MKTRVCDLSHIKKTLKDWFVLRNICDNLIYAKLANFFKNFILVFIYYSDISETKQNNNNIKFTFMKRITDKHIKLEIKRYLILITLLQVLIFSSSNIAYALSYIRLKKNLSWSFQSEQLSLCFCSELTLSF